MRRLATMALLFCCFAASAETLDEVLAKHVAAMGGREKIMALNAVQLSGNIMAGQQPVAAFRITKKRPNLVRIDLTMHGLVSTQAFDGEHAWQNAQFPVSAESAKELLESADFDGPLIDGALKGYQLTLSETASTEPFIIVIARNSSEERVALDRVSFLVVRHLREGLNTTITDYGTVEGLTFPVRMRRSHDGVVQEIHITHIDISPLVSSTFFKETTNATQ